jgi:outer membrane protein assembly factor BamD (BamD/ComL family)
MNRPTLSKPTVQIRVRQLFNQAIGLMMPSVLFLLSGCASFDLFKREGDEYQRASNAINGYEDSDGNWVRPEGTRADKSRDSKVPKFLHFIPGMAPSPINKELAKSTYQQADELFNNAAKQPEGTSERRNQFRAAAKKYKEAGKHWESSALEENALYMAGESYFFAEDYPKAEDFYVKLVKERPRTRYQDMVDKRRMEIGLFWGQFQDEFYHLNFADNRKPWNDTRKHGIRVLEKMRLDNPVGRLADDVTMELANSAFKRGNWNDALDAYEDLISTYASSPHQFDAHFFGVKSALKSYQGPDYSVEPLDTAEKLIVQMKRQFREKAEKEKQQIEEQFLEVRFLKAQREYHLATYRMNKQEARAARTHCATILSKYADTPFAEKAKAIMDKTEGMPEEPEQTLKVLADLFPSNDKFKGLTKPTPNIEDQDPAARSAYERTAIKSAPDANNAGGTTKR